MPLSQQALRAASREHLPAKPDPTQPFRRGALDPAILLPHKRKWALTVNVKLPHQLRARKKTLVAWGANEQEAFWAARLAYEERLAAKDPALVGEGFEMTLVPDASVRALEETPLEPLRDKQGKINVAALTERLRTALVAQIAASRPHDTQDDDDDSPDDDDDDSPARKAQREADAAEASAQLRATLDAARETPFGRAVARAVREADALEATNAMQVALEQAHEAALESAYERDHEQTYRDLDARRARRLRRLTK